MAADSLSLAQAALTFVASAGGALVAGYAGVYFGLSKLRRERAFDRRLDWYTRMIATMQEIASKGALVPYAPTRQALDTLVEELEAATIRFHQQTGESRLYASAKGYTILNELVAGLDELSPGVSDDVESLRSFQQGSIKLMRYGVAVLTDDVRAHLGIEPLPPPPVASHPMPATPPPPAPANAHEA